jgi:hypothetical protein
MPPRGRGARRRDSSAPAAITWNVSLGSPLSLDDLDKLLHFLLPSRGDGSNGGVGLVDDLEKRRVVIELLRSPNAAVGAWALRHEATKDAANGVSIASAAPELVPLLYQVLAGPGPDLQQFQQLLSLPPGESQQRYYAAAALVALLDPQCSVSQDSSHQQRLASHPARRALQAAVQQQGLGPLVQLLTPPVSAGGDPCREMAQIGTFLLHSLVCCSPDARQAAVAAGAVVPLVQLLALVEPEGQATSLMATMLLVQLLTRDEGGSFGRSTPLRMTDAIMRRGSAAGAARYRPATGSTADALQQLLAAGGAQQLTRVLVGRPEACDAQLEAVLGLISLLATLGGQQAVQQMARAGGSAQSLPIMMGTLGRSCCWFRAWSCLCLMVD